MVVGACRSLKAGGGGLSGSENRGGSRSSSGGHGYWRSWLGGGVGWPVVTGWWRGWAKVEPLVSGSPGLEAELVPWLSQGGKAELGRRRDGCLGTRGGGGDWPEACGSEVARLGLRWHSASGLGGGEGGGCWVREWLWRGSRVVGVGEAFAGSESKRERERR